MNPKFLIIGAGPTGLGAGYRLKELGIENFQIYERSPYIGGLASSFTDSTGFTWDIGGHVMFSHYKYYDQCFDKLMGNEFQMNMRECWVRMMDRWVPYPFQNNIRYLPKEVTCECLTGLIEAQTKRDHKSAENFEQFMEAVFGDGICKHFMKPYNFKVWAHPSKLMNKEWIGERVAIVDIQRALKNVIIGSDDFGWGPNNQFKFPLRGGTGEFYRRFGEPLHGHVHLQRPVASINLIDKRVRMADGEIIKYDVLISAMPLDILCNHIISNGIPDELRKSAASLRHSGGYMVGIGFKQKCPSTKSWMYFPEDNCPFYRATYLSNYSPYMTPDNEQYYSLLCETSYSEFKPVDGDHIVEATIDGLVKSGLITDADRKDVCDTWVHHAAYSYPTPSVERDSILAKVIPYLESHGIYSRGRFGMWKYEVSNTDHTLMQGVELIDRLLLGQDETTIGMRYASTADGRNAAVHERSTHAGSGDPKRRGVSVRTKVVTGYERNGNGAHATNGSSLKNGRATQPGDKTEAHISEEELGITTTPKG